MIKLVSIVSVLAFISMMPSAYASVFERLPDPALLSAEGRFMVFSSSSTNIVPGDSNKKNDVFVRDRRTGDVERISVSSISGQANNHSGAPAISADGRVVVFSSSATNLVAGDTNGKNDLFVSNLDTGEIERVNVSSSGVQANGGSGSPTLSANGRYVLFESNASNLIDGRTIIGEQVYIRDNELGTTQLLSVSLTGEPPNGYTISWSISADGRFVSFNSVADNLVENDTNNSFDTFVHDRSSGTTERVSITSDGLQTQGENVDFSSSISANGRFVAFASGANNVVESDTNGQVDVFVHDRATGITERVSVSSNGEQGNGRSGEWPKLSADGRFVTFFSSASNLVDNDTNNSLDVFVHDRDTGMTERVSKSLNGEQANAGSSPPALSADGRFVVFGSSASNLIDGEINSSRAAYIAVNTLFNFSNDLSVTLRPSSRAVAVGRYTHFRAYFKNNSDAMLTNCIARMVNPLINYRREFSFRSWPLKVTNPVVNGAISIAPGETGQINLGVLPRVAMAKEISFYYVCDEAQAYTTSFINTAYLTAKTEPLISEDFVRLENSNHKTDLVVDRNNGKYWTPYVVKVINTGTASTAISLTTMSRFPNAIIRQPQLCEPIDPLNNDWSCTVPRDTQVQVELAAGETKRVLVYVHARQAIKSNPFSNRLKVVAHDATGEIVAITSMGISTIN